jgi:hypothetical protein
MSNRVFSLCQSGLRPTALLAAFVALLLGHASSAALADPATTPAIQVQAGKSDSLAGSLPAGATGYAEITGLGHLLERLQNSSYLQTLKSTPQFHELQKAPQYQQADAVRKIVEAQLGMDLWKAAEELFGGRLALAVYPKSDGNPVGNAVAVLRGANPAVLTQVRERIEPFLSLANAQPEASDVIPGTKLFSIGGQAFVAWGDSWLAAASTRELLDKSLGLLSGKEQGALANDEAFRGMSAKMGSEHVVRAFANMGLLTKAKGSRLTPEKVDNPVVSMLVGGILELAAASPYVGLALDVSDHRFVVTSGIAGDSRQLDEAHRVFFSDPAGPGTPDIPQLPSLIGGFTFHLDLANWYKQREKLLEPQVLPGFDQFETGIANLLPGKDVGEDIVPLIGRNVTFVAAPQDYSHLDGKPGVKLPGFGLVIELAKAEEGGDLFQLFFQTISAILNLASGQQKHEPWVMKSESYKDIQISYGRYLKKPVGNQLPLVFNFMPASARVGNKFIISSSIETCRQLIDQLQSPPRGPGRPNRNLDFEVHPAALADILEANREVFQARSIQQGSDSKKAEAEFSTLLELIRFFDSFRLSTNVLPEAFQVQLEGSWK